MSSAKPPVRKRSRSSGKSTSSRTQPSRRPTSDESQSPPENVELSAGPVLKEIAGKSTDPDEHQRDSGTPSKQVGDPELGMKPVHDTEVQDKITALHPISAKEGVLPDHATDKGEGEDGLNTGSRAEETPQDDAKTDKLAGNDTEDATGAPNLPKPTLEKSWEVIMKEVNSLDDGLVGGWKEDIDTLLVFAGLFSTVVTAFTIESYQWLREAPEDTTVTLLKQISQQMNGTLVPEPDTFSVSSSDVAINVLWFLSLIIALVDALFALLCKQWLREHRRHTHTRTPSEALALRWLRNQSLEKWRVPAIIASLPMLLELALFLFLAGLLELLRMRHPVLFVIAMIVVAFAAVFYLGTTIIPTVDIVRQALQGQVRWELQLARNIQVPKLFLPSFFIMRLPPMEYTCPYKSPQAWVAFQSLRLFSRILGSLHCAAKFLPCEGYITWSTYARIDCLIGHLAPTSAFGKTISNLSNWSSVDLELLQRADIELAPPFYELNAFRWLVAELRDSPHMIPHLRNILSPIPLHLVMPVVFDQWFFLPGRKWTIGDIETALAPNSLWRGIDSHLTLAKERFLSEGRETQLFNYLLHWIHVSMNGGDKRINSSQDSLDLFPIPFRCADAIPDSSIHQDLWDAYAKIAQDPAVPDSYWMTLTEDWARYIITSSLDYALHVSTATTTSQFVASANGCELLSKIHSTILERRLFVLDHSAMDWMEAMDILWRVHNFPENHFKPIPGHFPLPLSKLKKTLNSLSPTDLDNDFQYLDKLSRGWGDADMEMRVKLVRILSKHINSYLESDAGLSHRPGTPKISPIVTSSAGLELMTFVNNCLAEKPFTWWHLNDEGQTSWCNAIERVRVACPELPSDHFKSLFPERFELIDYPPSAERPSQWEVEVEAPAGDSGGSPRDITNEANRDEVNVRPNSAAELSPKLEPGELDERRPNPLDDGDTNEKGSIPMQPIVTEDLATGSGDTSSAVQGEEMVGGPDADKNV
ncbi:hypothetical protein PQX77_010314 [Marasmius sp. AFHP31]|nr:hypothetical protein PQX77_010314 [Marasmius sp. AFHP31]